MQLEWFNLLFDMSFLWILDELVGRKPFHYFYLLRCVCDCSKHPIMKADVSANFPRYAHCEKLYVTV